MLALRSSVIGTWSHGAVRMHDVFTNPPEEALRALLRRVKTVAVVGLSPKSYRPSHHVARNLKAFGYRIIPVYPGVDEVLGERAYARLIDIGEPVDLVNVFRAPQHVRGVIEECLTADMKALWLQEGVVDTKAALHAACAGMTVVMDRCIYRDYLRLMG
jgi:predicted CoA-binding protein